MLMASTRRIGADPEGRVGEKNNARGRLGKEMLATQGRGMESLETQEGQGKGGEEQRGG